MPPTSATEPLMLINTPYHTRPTVRPTLTPFTSYFSAQNPDNNATLSRSPFSRASRVRSMHMRHSGVSSKRKENLMSLIADGFLPRCMECRRGLAMSINSVRLYVCPSVKRVDLDKTKQ